MAASQRIQQSQVACLSQPSASTGSRQPSLRRRAVTLVQRRPIAAQTSPSQTWDYCKKGKLPLRRHPGLIFFLSSAFPHVTAAEARPTRKDGLSGVDGRRSRCIPRPLGPVSALPGATRLAFALFVIQSHPTGASLVRRHSQQGSRIPVRHSARGVASRAKNIPSLPHMAHMAPSDWPSTTCALPCPFPF